MIIVAWPVLSSNLIFGLNFVDLKNITWKIASEMGQIEEFYFKSRERMLLK